MKIPASSDRQWSFFSPPALSLPPCNASSQARRGLPRPNHVLSLPAAPGWSRAICLFAAGKASIPPGFSAFHEPANNSPHIWHRPQNDIPAKIQSSPARSNPDTRPGKGGGTFLLPSGPAPSKDSAPAHVPGGLKDPKAPSPFFLPKPRPHRHRIFLIPHYIKERQSPHPWKLCTFSYPGILRVQSAYTAPFHSYSSHAASCNFSCYCSHICAL